MFFHSVKVR